MAILHATKFFSRNVSHTSISYLVYLPLCRQGQIGGKPSRPTQKGENGLYPPTQRGFEAFAIFSKCFSSLAWVTGQGPSWGRGFGTGRHSETLQAPPCAQPGRVFGKCLPCCKHPGRQASSWAGLCPGGGRSALVRPKDRGLNGIKTPERTRPTSDPGYMPRHPTPKTLKPLAVREVNVGKTCGTHRPAPVGIFVTEEPAMHAHILSCLPLLLAVYSLPQTIIYSNIGYGFLFVARS